MLLQDRFAIFGGSRPGDPFKSQVKRRQRCKSKVKCDPQDGLVVHCGVGQHTAGLVDTIGIQKLIKISKTSAGAGYRGSSALIVTGSLIGIDHSILARVRRGRRQ